MEALTLLTALRRDVFFAESRPRLPSLFRMPALGLNGGVGNVTLPTLRPCLPRYTPTPWPRAGAGDSRKKTDSRTAAVATLVSSLFKRDSPVI